MSITSVAFSVFERLAAAKLNLFAADVNAHNHDGTYGVQIAASNLTGVVNIIYPVGCIYTSTVATNPGTVFGVGTWVAYGAGKVLVGKNTSGTFVTAGSTGGVETVTLSAAESGSPAHSHVLATGNGAPGGGVYRPTNYSNNTAGTAFTTNNSTATAASSAHTNLMPYVVVYLWNRTA